MKLLTLLQEGTWNNGKDPSKDKDYQQLDLIIDSDNCIIINLTIANPTLFSDATEINQKIQDLYDQLVVELQQFHLKSDPKVLPIQTEFYKDKNSLKITRKGIDKLREHVKTHSSKAVTSPLLNLIGLLGNDKLLIKFCITELINSNVFRYVAPSSTKLAEPHYYLLNGDYNKGTMGVLLSEKFSIGIATLLNRRRGDIEFREHFKIPGSLCEETVILINPTDYRTLSILLQDVNVAPPSSPQAAISQSHGTAGASPSAVAASEITLAGAIAVLPPHFPALPKANAVVFTPASTESASIPAATDTSAAQANPAEKSANDLIDKRHDSQLLHEEMKMKFLELLKKGILTFQDEENGTKYNESVTLNVNENAPGLIIQISVERDKDTKEVKDDKGDQSDKISGQLYNSLMQDLTSKYNLVANESFTVDSRTRSIKITKRGLEKLREYCDKNAAVKSIIEPVLILADLYSTEAKLKKDSIAYLIQDSIILHTQEPSVKNDVTSPPTHKYFINPDFHGEGSTELHKLLFRGFATALSVLLSKRVSGSKDETVNKKRVRVFCINASEQKTLEEDLLKFQIPVLQLNQDSASALPPPAPAATDNATVVVGANTSPRRPPSPLSVFSDLSPSSGSTVPSSNGAATAALAAASASVVPADKTRTRALLFPVAPSSVVTGAEGVARDAVSGSSSSTVPFDLFADLPSGDGTAVPAGASAIPTRASRPPSHAAPPAPAAVAVTGDEAKNKKEKEDARLEKAKEQGGFNIFNGDSPSGAGNKPAAVTSAPPAASVVSTATTASAPEGSSEAGSKPAAATSALSAAPVMSASTTTSMPEGGSGAGSKPAAVAASAPAAPVVSTAAAAASAPEGSSEAGSKPAAATSALSAAPVMSASTTTSMPEGGSGAGSKPAAVAASAPAAPVVSTAAAAASAPEGSSEAGSKPAAAASALPATPVISASTTTSVPEGGSGAGSKPAAVASSAPAAPVVSTAATTSEPEGGSGAGSKPVSAQPVVAPGVSTLTGTSVPVGGSGAGNKPAAPLVSTVTTTSAAEGDSGAGSKPASAPPAAPVVSTSTGTSAPVSGSGTGNKPASSVLSMAATTSALKGGPGTGSKSAPITAASISPVSTSTSTAAAAAAAAASIDSSGLSSKPAAVSTSIPRPVPTPSSGGTMQLQTGPRTSSPPRMQRASAANSSSVPTGGGRGGRAALTASRTSPPPMQLGSRSSSSSAAGVWPASPPSAYTSGSPAAFGGQRPPEQPAGGRASWTSPPSREQASGAYSGSWFGAATTSTAGAGRGSSASGTFVSNDQRSWDEQSGTSITTPASRYGVPPASNATLQDNRRSASASYSSPPPTDSSASSASLASRHRPPARAKSAAVQRLESDFQQGLNLVRNAETAKAHLDMWIFNVAVQPYAVKEAIRDLIFDVFDRVLRGQPAAGRTITDELCELYAYINLPTHKEKINIRANPRLDFWFSKPNTNSWVNIVEWLREQATQQLFRDAETAHPLDLSRRKIFLLGYREHNLFAEHTSNKYLATIGRTRAVKAIDEKVHEIDHPKRPTHTKNRHSIG